MGLVQMILLVGDYAQGLDSGTIDVVLIGNQLNTEYIDALEEKVEDLIDRKVNFSLASKPKPNQRNIVLYERV
jgi:hypothetical protein